MLVLGINEDSSLLNRIRVSTMKDLMYKILEKLNLEKIPSERNTYFQTVSVLSIIGYKLRDPQKFGLVSKDEFESICKN